MIAGLDTLLTALYVELTGHIIPSAGLGRRGPGKPPQVNEAELVCLAVAQVRLRWLAAATPASAELLRPIAATPIPCGQSVITARRPSLYGWAGYGYRPSHSRFYWGTKPLLICTCDGTVTGSGPATPKLSSEREEARQAAERQPASRPAPGTAIVTGKGLSGQGTEEFFASPGLGRCPSRP